MSKERLLLAMILVCATGLFLVFAFFLDDEPAGGPGLDGETGLGSRDGTDAESIEGDIDSEGRRAVSKEKLEPGSADDSKGDAAAARRRTGTGAIRGRVVSEFGVPLEGADVSVADRSFSNMGDFTIVGDLTPDGGASLLFCTSDAQGVFVLEDVARADSVELHVSHSDYVPLLVDVGFAGGTNRDVGDVILELGGSISGFITDENGKGLAEATARARPVDEEGGSYFFSFKSLLPVGTDWKAETGPDGFYTIRGLPPGKANVFADHAAHPPGDARGVMVTKGEETGNVDIVLPWGEAIAGRVVDPGGAPVSGATVAAIKDYDLALENLGELENLPFDIVANLSPAETDDEGRFRLEGLKKGKYSIRAKAKSFLPAVRKGVETGTDDLLLTVQAGGWLVGRVIDARTGEGIEGFDVEIDDEGVSGTDREIVRGEAAAAKSAEPIDPEGAFYVTGLEAETFDVVVRAAGYADETLSGLRVDPGDGITRTVELWPEAVFTGTLVTADGEPAASGTIVLESPPAELPEIVGEAELEAASAVLPGIRSLVELAGAKWDEVKTTTSDEAGVFTFRGVDEGPYRLVGSHRVHADSEPVEVFAARGEERNGIEVRLGLAGSIAGTAFAVDGEPKAGARVQVGRGGGLLDLVASDKKVFDGGGTGLPGLNTATTDSDGRFRFDGLAPGTYQVSLANPEDTESLGGLLNSTFSGLMGQGAAGAQRVQVEGGEVAEVELHETLKGSIIGAVSEAGKPVPGIKVNLFKGDLGFLAILPLKSTSTSRDGVYLFDALEEGSYDVRITIRGHAEPVKESVWLEAGTQKRLDFALPSGRVSGRVVDRETGEPLAGMRVSLKSLEKDSGGGGLLDALGVKTSTVNIDVNHVDIAGKNSLLGLTGPGPVQTGSDGRFEIPFVRDGEYTLTVSGGGYIKGERSPVKVVEGRETAGQDFALDKGWTVSGKVDFGATGEPASHCSITCERIVKGSAEPEKAGRFSSDEGGSFSYSGLAPGTYRLKANSDGKEGEEIFIIETADARSVNIDLW